MATWLNVPFDPTLVTSIETLAPQLNIPFNLGLPGLDLSTLVITATNPIPGLQTAYDGAAGGWQAGWNGTITPDGSNGVDVVVSLHPLLINGVWTFDVAVDSIGGLPGGGNWSFTVYWPAPTFTNKLPTGGLIPQDADVSFECHDAYQVDSATMNITLTPPVGAPIQVMINGAWQAPYNGLVNANVTHGYDVTLDTHPDFADGIWFVSITVDNDGGTTGVESWAFTVAWLPKLTGARASARRKITLDFDITVRLSDDVQLVVEQTDRYTPVDWIAAGGSANEALNPANYTITRPPGGDLDGPGEAVDLVVVACEEPPTGVTIVSGWKVATQVVLVVDYNQTPRCGYHMAVANLVHTTGTIDPAFDELDFDGHIASWVPRSSLHLIDILPPIAKKLDDAGTGHLALFCTVIQEVFDLFTADIDAFFNDLCTLDYMRPEWLDGLLYDMGDQFSELFDLTANEKRRLAGSLITMYREKGTCEGMVNAIDFFLGITILGCRGGWDDCWELAKGAYPAPVGGSFLSKGVYPAATGGDAYLGPVGSSIWSFWLLHPAPGALTADQLAKIAAIVDIIKPAYSHYMGVTTP